VPEFAPFEFFDKALGESGYHTVKATKKLRFIPFRKIRQQMVVVAHQRKTVEDNMETLLITGQKGQDAFMKNGVIDEP
jgi:hypothetical protein